MARTIGLIIEQEAKKPRAPRKPKEAEKLAETGATDAKGDGENA
jgi:hypothetical protein